MGTNGKTLEEIEPPYAGGREEKKKQLVGGMHFTDKINFN